MKVIEAARAADLRNGAALALIHGDQAAKRVLVAWTYMRPGTKDRELKSNEDFEEAIAEMWGEMPEEAIDWDELERIAEVPYRQLINIFARLKLARLIYPDGTASQGALAVISAESRMHVQHLLKRMPASPIKVPGA